MDLAVYKGCRRLWRVAALGCLKYESIWMATMPYVWFCKAYKGEYLPSSGPATANLVLLASGWHCCRGEYSRSRYLDLAYLE